MSGALSMTEGHDRLLTSPALGEVVGVWAMYGAVAAAISATERREHRLLTGDDPSKRRGSPVLAFAAHPWSLAALPQATLAWARLPHGSRSGVGLRASLAGGIGGSVVAWRRPAGGPPVAVDSAGVAIVVATAALTGETLWRTGPGGFSPPAPADRRRVALALLLISSSVPWIFADLGLHSGDIPGIGRLFLSRETPINPGDVAVHLGHHHGMDGTLLALTALALSRPLQSVTSGRTQAILSLWLSLLLVYGGSRTLEDFWNEQIVKRGRARRKPPIIVRQGRPEGRWAWLAIGAGAVVIDRCWFRPGPSQPWWIAARRLATAVSSRQQRHQGAPS